MRRSGILACALALLATGAANAQAVGAPPMVEPSRRVDPFLPPDPNAAQPTPGGDAVYSDPFYAAPPQPAAGASASPPAVGGPPLDVDRVMDGAKRCWTAIPRVYGTEAQGGFARLRIKFTPEGRLDGPPLIIDKPQGAIGAKFAESAARAVEGCQPYALPPARFAEWRVIEMRFDTIDPDNPPPPPPAPAVPPPSAEAPPTDPSIPENYVPSVPAPADDAAGSLPAPQ